MRMPRCAVLVLQVGVGYVLQGTLRRAGVRVRVAVEVTEAATGYNVWAHTYDQSVRDVFAVQDSVAVRVVEAVRGRLTGAERARLVAAPPTNGDAYRAYIAGRAAIRARTATAAARAIETRVPSRDPYFAYAYAGAAEFLSIAGRPLEAVAWASQGLSIDSGFAALYRQAAAADLHLGRWAGGRAAAARAIELGDVPAPNQALIAIASLGSGDTARARAAIDSLGSTLRAKLRRSPRGLSRTDAGDLAGAYAQLGQTDSAIAWVGRVAPWQRRFHAVRFLRHWMYQPLWSDPRFQALFAETR